MEKINIGVIGGSGLYQMEGLEEIEKRQVNTPFGLPSDDIVIGRLGNEKVAFLPRHKRGHCILPSEVNSRANIYALKSLGVEQIISVSAVGSLKEEIKPLDIVIPDQLFDRTKARPQTFFGEGAVGHISFADPYCPALSKLLFLAGEELGYSITQGGTYICMEGPQFSTRAESNIYRQWGLDIIGMTNLPEAKLAREAEICYATIALVTDYDVWHESAADVTIEMVLDNLMKNVVHAKQMIKRVIAQIPDTPRQCVCATALKDGIITRPELIPHTVKEKLKLLIDEYL
ncbi:MAG: S-methyl-5'-thioadenosine phosphorylase [bacterium]|nr:S-methyl-5'-thioadenosine phosphorylase [bacterium]